MKKISLLILHGWGVDGEKYKDVIDSLNKKGFSVFAPDLPGFGKQKLIKKEMSVDDYVDFVRKFITEKKLSNVVPVGHSFGGRIAIKLAASQNPKILGLILTGSAGIKPDLAFFKRLIMYFAISSGELFRIPLFWKVKNRIRKLLYFVIGEWDYYKAGDLRETFKKTIAEDLVSYLSKITVPVLLVWGERDSVVPLCFGKKMEEIIPNSKLVVINERGHKLPYESPREFVNAIIPFLSKI